MFALAVAAGDSGDSRRTYVHTNGKPAYLHGPAVRQAPPFPC